MDKNLVIHVLPALTHPVQLDAFRALAVAGHEDLLTSNCLPVEGAQGHLSTFVFARSGLEVVGFAGVEPRGDVALLRSLAVGPRTNAPARFALDEQKKASGADGCGCDTGDTARATADCC